MENTPDLTIEQIESELRRARYDESDTDRFVRDRNHVRGRKIAMKEHQNKRLQLAYTAGYRRGAYLHPGWYLPAIAGWMLFIIVVVSHIF